MVRRIKPKNLVKYATAPKVKRLHHGWGGLTLQGIPALQKGAVYMGRFLSKPPETVYLLPSSVT